MGRAQISSLQPEAELGSREPQRVSLALALRPASRHCCLNNIYASVYMSSQHASQPEAGYPLPAWILLS